MKQRHFAGLQIDARGHLAPHAANEASYDNIQNRPLYDPSTGSPMTGWTRCPTTIVIIGAGANGGGIAGHRHTPWFIRG